MTRQFRGRENGAVIRDVGKVNRGLGPSPTVHGRIRESIGGGTAGDTREFPRLVQGSQGKVSFFPGSNFRPK